MAREKRADSEDTWEMKYEGRSVWLAPERGKGIRAGAPETAAGEEEEDSCLLSSSCPVMYGRDALGSR